MEEVIFTETIYTDVYKTSGYRIEIYNTGNVRVSNPDGSPISYGNAQKFAERFYPIVQGKYK